MKLISSDLFYLVAIIHINCDDVPVFLCSVNGEDEGEQHVDTPRYVQQKSVLQSGAGLAHEARSSAAPTTLSSRSSSGRSRPDASNVAVGPASSTPAPKSVQSYVETLHEAEQLYSVRDETVRDRSALSTPCSDATDTSSRHHDDTSRSGVTSHNSNLQSSVKTHESTSRSATTSQSGNHDRQKIPRLAVYNISSLFEPLL